MVFLFVAKEQVQIFSEIILVLKYILTVVSSCQDAPVQGCVPVRTGGKELPLGWVRMPD